MIGGGRSLLRKNLADFHVRCNVVVRPSVVRRLLSVCGLSVTLVRPTQAIEIFGNVSKPIATLANICSHPGKILRRSY